MVSKTKVFTFVPLIGLWFCCVSTGYEYEESYFPQKVDHFGFTNEDHFLQRYLSNMKFYDASNGTIFFYAGNEGDIEMFAENTGFMWENAEEFKAGLIFAEHRYYGKSMPYGDYSYQSNKYRGYLTSEQALADFASLVSYLKHVIPGGHEATFIVFGGSYGGMLAAWFRVKYPHLIDGAVASSAPILQFEGAAANECDKFGAVVTKDFQNEGIACPKSIRRSWAAIRKIGLTESGRKFLTDTFKLCNPLMAEDVDKLLNWLESTWSYLAMTDYPYPTTFLAPLPAYPIRETCKYLKNQSEPDEVLINNVAKAASVFHNYTGDVSCNDFNSSGGSSLGEEGWNFQACTEMVGPECYNGVTDMFEPQSWNFTSFSEECWKTYGVRPIQNMSSIIYGGRNITASSNIIFSNGKLDPWYPWGILNSLSDSLIAIVIEDSAHHLDLRSANPADPGSVTSARQLIKSWMWKWISQKRRFNSIRNNSVF